jgi:ATP-dependent exoDNAse (exonuclease V) beta subunit
VTSAPLPDDAARERIATNLDATLFVEARAGSGKTTVLVERIVALVLDGGVPVERIAAVTFTDKAADELRGRLRARLEAAATTGPAGCRSAAAAALGCLDSAALGTLHSFAQRVLSEHPIEAGLPPILTVLDEVASDAAFERRWDDVRAGLLTHPLTADLVRLALAAGLDLERHLRTLLRELDDDWDLVEERYRAAPPPGPGAVPVVEVGPLLHRARAVLGHASCCTDATDKLALRLPSLQAWVEQLAATTDGAELLPLLSERAVPTAGNAGQKGNWSCDVKALRQEWRDVVEAAAAVRAAAVDAELRALGHHLAAAVLGAARERAAQGRLEFHDLLVHARRLVRDRADVRAALQQRYPRLLLDEFQDTDPIQVELALRIAGGRDAGAADWRDIAVPPGSLFVVVTPSSRSTASAAPTSRPSSTRRRTSGRRCGSAPTSGRGRRCSPGSTRSSAGSSPTSRTRSRPSTASTPPRPALPRPLRTTAGRASSSWAPTPTARASTPTP